MLTATLTDTLTISMEGDCLPSCRDFAQPLYEQLSSGAYDECSVLPIPANINEWRAAHRTARKRAAKCRGMGYSGAVGFDRSRYEDDIYRINTSLAVRQGRPMSSGYLERQTFNDPAYPCPRHGVHYYGVRTSEGDVVGGGALVAYLWMYRAGSLALVSSILGHADHLERHVMYQLVDSALFGEIGNGPGTVVYNRHDSGTDGLRFFKERLGFRATDIEWAL